MVIKSHENKDVCFVIEGYREGNLYHLPLPNYFSRGKNKSLSLEALLISSNSNILCRISLSEPVRVHKKIHLSNDLVIGTSVSDIVSTEALRVS